MDFATVLFVAVCSRPNLFNYDENFVYKVGVEELEWPEQSPFLIFMVVDTTLLALRSQTSTGNSSHQRPSLQTEPPRGKERKGENTASSQSRCFQLLVSISFGFGITQKYFPKTDMFKPCFYNSTYIIEIHCQILLATHTTIYCTV